MHDIVNCRRDEVETISRMCERANLCPQVLNFCCIRTQYITCASVIQISKLSDQFLMSC